jgi:GNAT superfamily N-acetyltransferase
MTEIRQAELGDLGRILDLVNAVVSETYSHLLPNDWTSPKDQRPWIGSWVAVQRGVIVGVGLANDDCIDDLWILRKYRGHGIGGSLLSTLEFEIRNSGHENAKLRVVAENTAARRFYLRHGWQEIKSYPHEKWGFSMIDLQKDFKC